MTRADNYVSRVNWQAHQNNLVDTMTPHYLTLLELAWGDAQAKVPVLGAFDVHNPAVQKTVRQLARRVVGISDTTREDIRRILSDAFEAEQIPSVDEIGRTLREAGITSSVSRGLTVARTETATAYNTGAVVGYREAGVERVQVLDGDNDAECAQANGQVWTLDEANNNPIAHPNCVRSFSPVVD